MQRLHAESQQAPTFHWGIEELGVKDCPGQRRIIGEGAIIETTDCAMQNYISLIEPRRYNFLFAQKEKLPFTTNFPVTV
jgi:hypothetical protein